MLIFIDESGHPNPTDPSPYSVLMGTALNTEKSRDFSRELFNLKRGYKNVQNPYEWEIKGRDLINPKYISPRRREFIDEILALCRLNEVTTFASIMKRPPDQTLTPETDPHIHQLYKYIMRRVDCYVKETYPERRAIFLFDARDDKSNERLARRFTDYLYKTKKGQEYLHILDTPFFVNSKMTPGIQVSDLFAFIINKRFQKEGGPLIEDFYKKIKDLQFEWKSEEEEYILRGIKFIEHCVEDKEGEEIEAK